jgi:hypothetical protein
MGAERRYSRAANGTATWAGCDRHPYLPRRHRSQVLEVCFPATVPISDPWPVESLSGPQKTRAQPPTVDNHSSVTPLDELPPLASFAACQFHGTRQFGRVLSAGRQNPICMHASRVSWVDGIRFDERTRSQEHGSAHRASA